MKKTILTKDLIGEPLNWAVTKIELDGCIARGENVKSWVAVDLEKGAYADPYSVDWSWGGPIIELERIHICPVVLNEQDAWQCWVDGHRLLIQDGPTPLIAAMRSYVASKLGDTVEIPEELLQS